jgi:hypothetical protein
MPALPTRQQSARTHAEADASPSTSSPWAVDTRVLLPTPQPAPRNLRTSSPSELVQRGVAR